MEINEVPLEFGTWNYDANFTPELERRYSMPHLDKIASSDMPVFGHKLENYDDKIDSLEGRQKAEYLWSQFMNPIC